MSGPERKNECLAHDVYTPGTRTDTMPVAMHLSQTRVIGGRQNMAQKWQAADDLCEPQQPVMQSL